MYEIGAHDPQWEATARKVREELARRRMSRQAIGRSRPDQHLDARESAFGAAALHHGDDHPARGSARRSASRSRSAAERLATESGARGDGRLFARRGALARGPLCHVAAVFHRHAARSIPIARRSTGTPSRSCLCFSESERSDAGFTQHGSVSMPHLSGHIYLVTNEGGQYRLAILAPSQQRPAASTASWRPCSRPRLAAGPGRLPDRLAADRPNGGTGFRTDRGRPRSLRALPRPARRSHRARFRPLPLTRSAAEERIGSPL